jgi:hypothetical protein
MHSSRHTESVMASRFLRAARGAGALASVIAVALSACGGPENIELVGVYEDAGTGGDDRTIPDDAARSLEDGGDRRESGVGGDAPPVDAPDVGVDAQCARAATVCLSYGDACVEGIECCSGRCERGVCLEIGMCNGPGASCAARSDCCSGLCENHTCLNYCKADGLPCRGAHDCCSLACNGGRCGGTLCRREEACSSNADCCSGVCAAHDEERRCAPAPSSPSSCIVSGAQCDVSGGQCTLGGAGCCGGAWIARPNNDEPRCDPGDGPCRSPGMLCRTKDDCCGDATCGVPGDNSSLGYAICILTTPLRDGEECTSAAQCVGRVCTGNPPKCAPAAPSCKLIGATCGGDGDCCSGQCLENKCGNICAPE